MTGSADIAWDEVLLTGLDSQCQSARPCVVLTHEATGVGAVFHVKRGAQSFSAALVPPSRNYTYQR
ncbi:hypothetical protein JCM18882A_01230 [Brevibacterium metallidurans]|uniref:Uncharacterized protein n=1 Tax=Brevibacterium metallidurans TaxID=1482676 RepID=A0ABN0SJG6_9MICO